MATVVSRIDSPFTVAGQHRIRTDFPFKQIIKVICTNKSLYFFVVNDIDKLAKEIFGRNLTKNP